MIVHVVADSDTRWKWGAALAYRLGGTPTEPIRLHGHLLEGRATPSSEQLADVSADAATVQIESMRDVLAGLRDTAADVIVLACVGGTIQALLHGLARSWEHRTLRPVVVTGYVGVVYERIVDGLLLRAGADVVVANSPADERHFRSVYSAVGGVDPGTVVRDALPFLDDRPHDPSAVGASRPFTVTFVAQPSVPATRSEREYAAVQAVEHARRHPERHVIVKLRGRVGEQTTHVERHHYSTLLPVDDLPDNIEIVYGSMADVLDRTDLCVTVSSTAALEAVHRRIPVAVLTDFGVRESLGNHFFVASGALASWAELHEGTVPKVDPEWATDNGVGELGTGELPDRIAALRAARDELPPLRAWWSVDAAPCYLPRLLERNGLDPDGVPLDALPPGTVPGRGRRAARVLARGVYRVGVHTIEPRIRRWAAL